jgi:hypothetical protein
MRRGLPWAVITTDIWITELTREDTKTRVESEFSHRPASDMEGVTWKWLFSERGFPHTYENEARFERTTTYWINYFGGANYLDQLLGP